MKLIKLIIISKTEIVMMLRIWSIGYCIERDLLGVLRTL